jgi:polygalacturonase
MFGAVGDGATNDAVAIQAAMDSGEIVLIPKKTYLISAQLTIPSNLHIISQGGTIKRGTNVAAHMFYGSSKSNINNGLPGTKIKIY